MVFGGAVSDRFSARIVMLASDLARLALMIGLVFLVMSGATRFVIGPIFALMNVFYLSLVRLII